MSRFARTVTSACRGTATRAISRALALAAGLSNAFPRVRKLVGRSLNRTPRLKRRIKHALAASRRAYRADTSLGEGSLAQEGALSRQSREVLRDLARERERVSHGPAPTIGDR
jgi:hypothetical protein